MSGQSRICVIFLPSSQEHPWRSAFRNAAETAGWRVVNGHDPAARSVADDRSLLIELSDGGDVPAFNPTGVLVVADKPQAAIETLMADFGIPYRDAVRAAARFYGLTAAAVRASATVVDAQAVEVSVPELGTVERDKGISSVSASVASGPLDFYQSLPPQDGARAIWPIGLFDWNGPEPGRADLTGNRRLLQHGPYLELCAGVWRIDLRFAMTLESGRAELRFEWGTGADCVSHSEVITRGGIYGLSLEREWPAVAACELRLWMDRAMFDGAIEVQDCSVTLVRHL